MNTETDFNVFTIRSNLLARGDKVATPRWAAWVRQTIARVANNYGGEDVLSWWLAERTAHPVGITRARLKELQRACGGSQSTLNRLIRWDLGEHLSKRFRSGWTAMDVTHYLSILLAEQGGIRNAAG